MMQKIIEIVIIFSVFFLPGYIFQNNPALSPSTQFSNLMLSYLIVAIPHIFLLIYLLWLQKSPPLKEFGIVKPGGKVLFAFPVYCAAFAVIAPLLIILNLLPADVQKQITSQLPWKIEYADQMPLVVLFCLVTGYREELFFRSYLLTRFSELKLNRHLASLISALAFGGAHIYQNVFGFMVAFLLGLFFSYVFYEWKNVHIIALAHAAYNFTIFIINI
jgi:membrane protease YdiL (CAAX protease family)